MVGAFARLLPDEACWERRDGRDREEEEDEAVAATRRLAYALLTFSSARLAMLLCVDIPENDTDSRRVSSKAAIALLRHL